MATIYQSSFFYLLHLPQTHQISELEVVEQLDISLFGLLLVLVQLPPEAIDCSHVQYLGCIYLPSVAVTS